MGLEEEEEEVGITTVLIPTTADSESTFVAAPSDSFHLAYIIFFTLGLGFLLPWNAFITAVDYFSYLYPSAPVDRVFSISYMFAALPFLLLIVLWAHLSSASRRINAGLILFLTTLVVAPSVDVVYVKGRTGVYRGYWVVVAAVAVTGLADALVQSGLIGSAGEMPERYMQATFAGTAASGVLVSVMRIVTKSMYPHDADGLRKSANVYFIVGIVAMAICFVCYNMAQKLPIIQYYKDVKRCAVEKEQSENGIIGGSSWRSTLWTIVGRIKWPGFGIFLIYIVTLSIFPGYITEDVHSETLTDWYPIILIASFNIFDLIGKSLTAVYLLQNENTAVIACVGRLLFYPLFLACLHGPDFFRTEIPVTVLTCLLGLTNGYLTSVLMILTPKSVPIQHSEMVGIVMVLFLFVGLTVGSVVSWFWVL